MADKTPLKAIVSGTERRLAEYETGDTTGTAAGGTGATTIAQAAINLAVIPTSEKGAVGGVATLDGGGKIPSAQIPAVALPEVFFPADDTARLALTVQEGDEAIQIDTGGHWIYDGTTWNELANPANTVGVNDDGSPVVAATNTINFVFPLEATDAGGGVVDINLGRQPQILLADGLTLKYLE